MGKLHKHIEHTHIQASLSRVRSRTDKADRIKMVACLSLLLVATVVMDNLRQRGRGLTLIDGCITRSELIEERCGNGRDWENMWGGEREGSLCVRVRERRGRERERERERRMRGWEREMCVCVREEREGIERVEREEGAKIRWEKKGECEKERVCVCERERERERVRWKYERSISRWWYCYKPTTILTLFVKCFSAVM